MPEAQPDKPSRGQRTFFVDTVSAHDKVESIEAINDQLYAISRTGNLDTVLAYITNVYTLGLADVMDIQSRCRGQGLDCIVTMSNWNEYTGDAKRYAAENRIGVFTFREFMGALNLKTVWKYFGKRETGNRNARYK